MKKILFGAALAILVSSAMAATNVGVSVSVGQPGFYGRIDLGNAPQPQVIYAEPVIVQQAPVAYPRQPIYLRVQPGHEKHWEKNCHRYNACGQPVYFVQDSWYRNEYARDHRGNRGDQGNRDERGGRNEGRGDNGRGDNGRGHDHERNKGRGND